MESAVHHPAAPVRIARASVLARRRRGSPHRARVRRVGAAFTVEHVRRPERHAVHTGACARDSRPQPPRMLSFWARKTFPWGLTPLRATNQLNIPRAPRTVPGGPNGEGGVAPKA